MPCDTQLKPKQTPAERMLEVRKAAQRIDKLLVSKRIGVKVGPAGGVVFTGLSDADRDGLTDNCIVRRLMQSGSAAAKLAIARAERLAGRSIDRKAIASGLHSHDGGQTWSTH